jgi:arylformamidase
MAHEWIDVSLPVRHGMIHWPDNPVPEVVQTSDMKAGAVCNLTRVAFGVHTGTHMDSMRHFVADGITIEQMPIDASIGPARLIAIDEPAIRREHLEPYHPQRGERLLIKTSNSDRCWVDDTFREDYVGVEDCAAKFLVECGIRTIGVDYLTVAPWHDTVSTHVTLLSAGIWIIEGLDFRGVAPGDYDLVCLPLKIVGSDGSPARCVIRPR